MECLFFGFNPFPCHNPICKRKSCHYEEIEYFANLCFSIKWPFQLHAFSAGLFLSLLHSEWGQKHLTYPNTIHLPETESSISLPFLFSLETGTPR